MAQLTNKLLLLALCVNLARANCPLHGCSPSFSYISHAQFVTENKQPKLIWSWKGVAEAKARPSGLGCVTNAARIICPAIGEEGKSFLICWDTVDDGKTPWNVSLVGGGVVLPLVDFSGDFIASDGSVLIGYQADGTPFGKPIHLFPINGQLFDLTLVNNQIPLLYKCGFLATYFSNGIPQASIWLNDTLDGEKGTFIPLNSPVSKGQRIYILGAFRPHSKSSSQSDLKLRIFAIDLINSAAMKIYTAWSYDFTIPSVTLPYLNSAETICTVKPPPPGSLKSELNSKNSLVRIIVHNNVTVLFNYRELDNCAKNVHCQYSKLNISRMMIFEDLGKTFKLRFSADFTNPFQTLAYDVADSFWTGVFDVIAKQSVIQQYSYLTDKVLSSINISNLLAMGNKQVNITSEMTFLHVSSSSHPLIFCVLVEETHSLLVAVDVSQEKLLWTVDMGSAQCVGQISSVDGAKDTFLVVTTYSEMLVYSLT